MRIPYVLIIMLLAGCSRSTPEAPAAGARSGAAAVISALQAQQISNAEPEPESPAEETAAPTTLAAAAPESPEPASDPAVTEAVESVEEPGAEEPGETAEATEEPAEAPTEEAVVEPVEENAEEPAEAAGDPVDEHAADQPGPATGEVMVDAGPLPPRSSWKLDRTTRRARFHEHTITLPTSCLGFRDNGYGVLIKGPYVDRRPSPDVDQVRILYHTLLPDPDTRLLFRHPAQGVKRFWGVRLEKFQTHIEPLKPVECVPALSFRERRHGGETSIGPTLVMQTGRIVTVQVDTGDPVIVRTLQAHEDLTEVFVHPTEPALVLIVDYETDQQFERRPLLVRLDDLAPVADLASVPARPPEAEALTPEAAAPEPAAPEAEEPAAEVPASQVPAAAEGSAEPDTVRIPEPPPSPWGEPADFHAADHRVFTATAAPCVAFSSDGGSVFLRRTTDDLVIVEELRGGPSSGPALRFQVSRDAPPATHIATLVQLNRQLRQSAAVACAPTTRRGDGTWFAAVRGRPLLIEAAGGAVESTWPGGVQTVLATLEGDERLATVFQHPSKGTLLLWLDRPDGTARGVIAVVEPP